ncbi:hypothetical protein A9Q78_11445 [Methylophaga sp. 41_12_T18]|mgnify:FL=1|nr:hypothetical protein A9Q78_11445 [Methylophaga sp. 41_12_T18]
MHKQYGQSMVEYAIVCAALISALFWGANAECDGHENCLGKLLTVMHDNYDGYSSSISAIQQYGEFENGDFDDDSEDGGGDSGGGSDGGGSESGGGMNSQLNPDGLAEVTTVSTTNQFITYGYLAADGTVTDNNGNVVGVYDADTNTIELNDGSVTGVSLNTEVVDEEGNVLHIRAITNCIGAVHSWGYVSKATGKVFNSLNRGEMDIGSLCTKASFKVVNDGVEQPGRVIDGEYYASVFAADVSATPLTSSGEVIYWDDLGICSVMVNNWDGDVDTDQDDDDVYADRLALFNDDDRNLGEMDQFDYIEQTALYGVPTESNNCPSSRVLSEP